MSSFNKIILVGYLGRDPEIRYTQTGKAVCSFSIATNEKRGDQEIATWFRVIAWERIAEVANEHLAKGRQVYVEGTLRLEEYTDRNGAKRQSLEVTANQIHFLGSKNGSAAENSSSHKTQTSNSKQTEGDDDVPF